MMGKITEDFIRLVGEIQGGHMDRRRMMRDLGRGAADLKREVMGMQAGFQAAHAEMSKCQKNELRDFADGIQNEVGGLLKGFAGDLAGGRLAWEGGNPLAHNSGRIKVAGMTFGSPTAEAANAAPRKAAAKPSGGATEPRGSAKRRKKNRG